jgi:hypothetical protein
MEQRLAFVDLGTDLRRLRVNADGLHIESRPLGVRGVGVGSGQFATPWERMHRANVRMSLHDCCSAARVGRPPGPFGNRCMQALWAAWSWGLLTPSWCGVSLGIPPVLLGSGKFDTLWERMQREKASAPFSRVDAAGGLEDPHPAARAAVATPPRTSEASARLARNRLATREAKRRNLSEPDAPLSVC